MTDTEREEKQMYHQLNEFIIAIIPYAIASIIALRNFDGLSAQIKRCR